MPIVTRTNNRVLPANAHASDVARDTITALTAVERTRYAAVFAVQGYPGVLYHALNCGTRCYCKSSNEAINTRLGKDGKAPVGLLNEFLTGGLEFGVLPYGLRPAAQPTYNPNFVDNPFAADPLVPAPASQSGQTGQNGKWVIDQTLVDPGRPTVQRTDLPSLYESDWSQNAPVPAKAGSPLDRFTKDPGKDNGTTVVSSGVGPNGVVPDMEFEDLPINTDIGAGGTTDVNCPICMGTGFVNGFSILNGFRKLLTFQDPTAVFDGEIIFEGTVPQVECTTATFTLTLPAQVVGVDALRVWDRYRVLPAAVIIDDVVLKSQLDILRFCDGRQHTLVVQFPSTTKFTHVEIQLNQAKNSMHFDLPKLSKGNLRTLIENTQDFQLVVSPMVPMLRPGDVVAESGYNKVLQITSVSGWNTSSAAVLGWDCEVHPVQPQELLNLLPRRRPLAAPNAGTRVRTNVSGHRRT